MHAVKQWIVLIGRWSFFWGRKGISSKYKGLNVIYIQALILIGLGHIFPVIHSTIWGDFEWKFSLRWELAGVGFDRIPIKTYNDNDTISMNIYIFRMAYRTIEHYSVLTHIWVWINWFIINRYEFLYNKYIQLKIYKALCVEFEKCKHKQ